MVLPRSTLSRSLGNMRKILFASSERCRHSSHFRACSESQKYQSIGPSRSLNMSFIAARLQHQWHHERVRRRFIVLAISKIPTLWQACR